MKFPSADRINICGTHDWHELSSSGVISGLLTYIAIEQQWLQMEITSETPQKTGFCLLKVPEKIQLEAWTKFKALHEG